MEKFLTKENQNSLQLKYIPNVKPFQPKPKNQGPIYSDAINQYKQEIIGHLLTLEVKNCLILLENIHNRTKHKYNYKKYASSFD